MNTGLTSQQSATISRIVSHYPQIEQVLLFGSRAKGTHRSGSDIDLAVKSATLSFNDYLLLRSELSDACFPYRCDVVHYDTISDSEVTEHIDRVGIMIYSV